MIVICSIAAYKFIAQSNPYVQEEKKWKNINIDSCYFSLNLSAVEVRMYKHFFLNIDFYLFLSVRVLFLLCMQKKRNVLLVKYNEMQMIYWGRLKALKITIFFLSTL